MLISSANGICQPKYLAARTSRNPVLNRPLETTFWIRFKQLMKGVFLYNTIYWRRASDDLDIQRMSREERASLRPKRNLEIIRPRERPAARSFPTQVLSLPPEYGERSDLPPLVQISEPPPPPVAAAPSPVKSADADETVEIHRRKKRRRSRHSKVMPKRYYDPSSEGSRGGILGWLFKK